MEKAKKSAKRVDINGLKDMLSRLEDAFIEGKMTMDKYRSKWQSITGRISAAERQNMAVPKDCLHNILSDFDEEKFRKYYSELAAEEKAAFWKSVLERIDLKWTEGVRAKKGEDRYVPHLNPAALSML